MCDLLPAFEFACKAARNVFAAALAVTERAVPFDEARADAWLKTSATNAAGADGEGAVSAQETEPAPSRPTCGIGIADLLAAAECVQFWIEADNCNDTPENLLCLGQLKQRLLYAARPCNGGGPLCW